MKGQTKNEVSNNMADFWTILAIALGATILLFNLRRKLDTTQPAGHSFPQDGGENQENKSAKIRGWR